MTLLLVMNQQQAAIHLPNIDRFNGIGDRKVRVKDHDVCPLAVEQLLAINQQASRDAGIRTNATDLPVVRDILNLAGDG